MARFDLQAAREAIRHGTKADVRDCLSAAVKEIERLRHMRPSSERLPPAAAGPMFAGREGATAKEKP